MTRRSCAPIVLLASLAALTPASAQVVVETFSGTGTTTHTMPGTPQGGGVDFGTAGSLTTINFTPGSVTFQGQPVDFSGTEASWLATGTSGTSHFPVNSGPATVTLTGSALYSGAALNAHADQTTDSLDLGPGFSASNLDIVNPSSFDDFHDVPSWSSPVVPELNGYRVIIAFNATVTSVDPVNGIVDYDFTGQVVAGPGPILFGPPMGPGCAVGAGDSLVGSPGNAEARTHGVAATAANATVTDTDNDGTITVVCDAARDFQVSSFDDLIVTLDVDGSWNSAAPIDVTADFLVVVDPGGLGTTHVVNPFASSTGGVLSGSAQSAPFTPQNTNNNLQVQGNFQLDGPSGFSADVVLPASIDGNVFLAPPAVPSLDPPRVALLALLVAGLGALGLRYRSRLR